MNKTQKNYFPTPNEIFSLGLSPGEFAVYSYLLRCANWRTYQCWPSYKNISNAVRMSANTVDKHVCSLADKGLISTEDTTVFTKTSLHDETFLKENLETLFTYRQDTGFRPITQDPDEGWMGAMVADWMRIGKYLEQSFDLPELPAPPTWTDSKQC